MLDIINNSIVKINNRFIGVTFEFKIDSTLTEDFSSYYIIDHQNVFINPKCKYFENIFKMMELIDYDKDTLGKFSTINIINVDLTKTYKIDYVFALLNENTKKYFGKYDFNPFHIHTDNLQDFISLNKNLFNIDVIDPQKLYGLKIGNKIVSDIYLGDTIPSDVIIIKEKFYCNRFCIFIIILTIIVVINIIIGITINIKKNHIQ